MQIRVGNFSDGFRWTQEAWELFTKQIGFWLVAGLILIAASITTSMILPIIGIFASSILSTILIAGCMSCAELQSQGETPDFNQLFRGFKDSLSELVILAVLYVFASFAALIPTGLSVGSTMFEIFLNNTKAENIEIPAVGLVAGMGVLLTIILHTLLVGAMLYAPALVLLQKRKPLEAMKLSLLGCLRNVLAFLPLSFIVLVLTILALIPFGLGLFLLFPFMILIIYRSYAFIFASEAVEHYSD